ncbi:elongation factor G [Oricola cellulosilytica]|uniref:Elongation factor G n=1 Tax=Oricola cellulosilytica TaxID=1429082 RepID=A0A4R0PFH1_9HYPH|nr:elongation factor G [Oricola cellulosilytica]TCD16587.1 elongation factor G [Oricola cellulosilytica]
MRCFTILGPSHSGKTTLAQRLSELEGKPARSETVGHMAFTRFSFMGDDWCAIDVAGGPELAGQSGGALLASDAAILCVPSDPDAAVLAAPYLRAIQAAGTPCLIFINRMDAPKGRVRDIVAALQSYCEHAIVLRQIPIREKGEVVGVVDLISERAWRYREGKPSSLVEIPEDAIDREQQARTELLEHLSDFDDALLEELIEDREPATGALYSISTRVMQENAVVPALLGAASHANGIVRLMKSLRHEAPQVDALRARLDAGGQALAVGFHARIKKHIGKSVYLRALAPGVAAGSPLGGTQVGNLVEIEGKGAVSALEPGEVAIAVKSDHLDAGKVFAAGETMDAPAWARGHPPVFARVLAPVNERDEVRLSDALAKAQQTDPGIALSQDEVTGHTVVRLQGPMHLRRLIEMLAEDFGVEAEDHAPSAIYRETISRRVEQHYRHRKQSGGAGQFADVKLVIEPQGRGAGFAFDDTVKGGAVPRNYIPSVEAGAKDALETGPFGFPVMDVLVTLLDGKHHSVDSSDHAFRTAGRMAVRDALQGAEPVLLQPIDKVLIHVPSVYSGAMVSLISSLKGQVLGFDRDPQAKGWDLFRALLPASAADELIRALGSATLGTAWYEAEFDHYEEIYGREAEKISREKAENAA